MRENESTRRLKKSRRRSFTLKGTTITTGKAFYVHRRFMKPGQIKVSILRTFRLIEQRRPFLLQINGRKIRMDETMLIRLTPTGARS